MISLCLQCCPLDMDAAMELTKLICDLEPERRNETEFFLVYRKDCSLYLPKCFENMATPKFGRARARPARNHDTGWPGGSNMLAASAFIEMSILAREDLCKNEAFLLFEPDCIPLCSDWLDQLSHEWDKVKALGKQAFGHWHQQGDASTLHMNGNAVWRVDFFDKHSTLIVGPATQGWDYWFRDHFIGMSCDSNLIFQHYNRYGLTAGEFAIIGKNGVRPAFFHGIKTSDGRRIARDALLPSAASAPPEVVQA